MPHVILAQMPGQAFSTLETLGIAFGPSFVLCVLFGVFVFYSQKLSHSQVENIVVKHGTQVDKLIDKHADDIKAMVDIFKEMSVEQAGAIKELAANVNALSVEMAANREILHEFAEIAEGHRPPQ